MKFKSLPAVAILAVAALAPVYGATVTSLTLHGGSFSLTFSANGQIWDTVPVNGIWVLGVSNPGTANPLLNAADTAIDIAPGAYYTYNYPTSFGTAVQVTATWSDLRSPDVGVFEVASLASATNWARLAGSTNIALGSTGITDVDKVGTSDDSSALIPDTAADNVLQVTIEGDDGSDVPEPATFTLLGLGLLVSCFVGWRTASKR